MMNDLDVNRREDQRALFVEFLVLERGMDRETACTLSLEHDAMIDRMIDKLWQSGHRGSRLLGPLAMALEMAQQRGLQ
jgi:hypothetical protein